MTDRTWRVDSTVSEPVVSDPRAADATSGTVNSATDTTGRQRAGTIEEGRFIERWNDRVRVWAQTRLKRLGVQTSDFEMVLHEFTALIAAADNPLAVKRALARYAQRIAPAHRVELTSVPKDSAPSPLAQGGRDPVVPAADADVVSNVQTTDLPLRCGPDVQGLLRIHAKPGRPSSLNQETVRRLTTLCTMSACALDRLYLHEGWPRGEATASPDDGVEANPHAAADGLGARFVKSPPLHDATFLYAVLPFALNQARRHQETLSLVCVAVDRLAGIQELMGDTVADELVNSVGETVAASIRTSDIVARLDDDRIIAVLPRAPGGGALYVGKKICEAVAHKKHLGYEIDGITVSIGVATFPSCADDVFSLFDAADFALVRAETEGRNRACLAPRRSAIATPQSEPASS